RHPRPPRFSSTTLFRSDAALLPISTARSLLDSDGAKFLGWVGDETPWQLGAVFASPKTLTNAALVKKLLGALARADREYHDVILDRKSTRLNSSHQIIS